MAETVGFILWKRIDVEGHDACRLTSDENWLEIAGNAVFLQDAKPCGLSYLVQCDARWRTRSAQVAGFLGDARIRYDIGRLEDGTWTLNGSPQPRAAGLVDLDLGFTPATNLLAIRRFDLGIGEETEAPAAYLAFPEPELTRLDQTYRRLHERRYAYASPAYGYDQVLEVASSGFVLDYPRLWKAVNP